MVKASDLMPSSQTARAMTAPVFQQPMELVEIKKKKPLELIELIRDGAVTIANMKAPPWHGEDCENVISPALLAELDIVLDEVEESGGALVLAASGKWFCNGLNMEFMNKGAGHYADRYIETFYKLLGRLVCAPFPIIAAVNGHAFAGGFLIAMCCDFRVMSDEKGLMCMPEVDMKGEVKPGRFSCADHQMLTVLQNKLPPLLVRDLMLQGRRLTASDALLRGIIDFSVAPRMF